MRALHILLLICVALAGAELRLDRLCGRAGGTKLLVTIRYDAVDSLQGNAGDRYRRPSSYGAGPGADPLLDALAAEYSITRVSGWPMRTLGVHCEVFATARGSDADALAARLAQDPRVDSAEPMHQFRTLTTRAGDPYRALQHSLDTLEVDAAHAISNGAGVRVAVIDSGIDASHHDLIGVVRARRFQTARSARTTAASCRSDCRAQRYRGCRNHGVLRQRSPTGRLARMSRRRPARIRRPTATVIRWRWRSTMQSTAAST